MGRKSTWDAIKRVALFFGLNTNNACNIKFISEKTFVHRNTVKKICDVFEAIGFIEAVKLEGRGKFYSKMNEERQFWSAKE